MSFQASQPGYMVLSRGNSGVVGYSTRVNNENLCIKSFVFTP